MEHGKRGGEYLLVHGFHIPVVSVRKVDGKVSERNLAGTDSQQNGREMYGKSELSLSTAQMAGRFLRYLSTKDSPVESVFLKPESASVSASISMLHAS